MASNRYIPIVSYKRGEVWALSNTTSVRKRKASPLVKLSASDTDAIEIVDDLSNAWADNICYFETSSHVTLTDVLDEIVATGAKIAPVTRLLNIPSFQAVIGSHPQSNGVMLRLVPSDFGIPALSAAINGLLMALSKNPAEVDILVDLGQQITAGTVAALAGAFVPMIPHLPLWRSLTLASSGMMPSTAIQRLPSGSWHLPPRFDWQSWLTVRTSFGRQADYGDYTVREPDLPPGFAPQYVTIRYTADDYFMIHREPKASTPPPYQPAISVSADLISRAEFSGQNFSKGDLDIYARATTPGSSPGSPECWIREAMNHHIALVVEAIAVLP